jgi:pimeloyl-ACP methyl ester carboxylesterase
MRYLMCLHRASIYTRRHFESRQSVMVKWILRILGGLAAVLVVLFVVTIVRFEMWKGEIEREIAANSQVVETEHGPIEYAEVGEGPAVLMLHGAPGGYDGPFRALTIAGAESGGLRYITPSRPGYLGTPLSVGATPAEQADAMVGLLDVLGVDRAAVIGESGGGPIALQFALRHPDRCSALVLISALVHNYSGPEAQVPPPGPGAFIRDLALFIFKDLGIATYQATDPDDPLITELAQAGVRGVVPLEARRAGVENDLIQQAHIDGWPLDRISCPTLILQGANDLSAPAADAEFAHEQIAGSELVMYPGQDHMLAITRHADVDARISAFVKSHQP